MISLKNKLAPYTSLYLEKYMNVNKFSININIYGIVTEFGMKLLI